MGKVMTSLSMSLDGFVAGPNDDVQQVFAWMMSGDKNVAVATASLTQQCLKAGLLDEIHIDLAPVLLGAGIRLFEHLGDGQHHTRPCSTAKRVATARDEVPSLR
jgi:dihydrofolate reductase